MFNVKNFELVKYSNLRLRQTEAINMHLFWMWQTKCDYEKKGKEINITKTYKFKNYSKYFYF